MREQIEELAALMALKSLSGQTVSPGDVHARLEAILSADGRSRAQGETPVEKEPQCDDTVHRWSDDFTDGDTCQCGAWYWFDACEGSPRRVERTPSHD